jgi:hypothetical protein
LKEKTEIFSFLYVFRFLYTEYDNFIFWQRNWFSYFVRQN